MNDEKQQKFTSKVRRGLVWVHQVSQAEMDRLREAAGGGRISGLTASDLADIDAALVWIAQNKETPAA
jgi:hypothetical protein